MPLWRTCNSGISISKTTKAMPTRSRTIRFVAPFGDIVQTAALVYLDAAVAGWFRPVITAFTRVAATDWGSGDEEYGNKSE